MPSILNQGRVSREEPEFIEDFDDEEKQDKIKQLLLEKDPYVMRLKPIRDDKCSLIRSIFKSLLER